jgi:cystathionine beta-lyase
MSREDYTARIVKDAKIAPNYGQTFGSGGDDFVRFNLATQRSRVVEAATRLKAAFSDLQ